MQGYQLTFFTAQDKRVDGKPIGEWLLQFAQQHGAVGGTLVGGGEGFDHLGQFHSAHFFEIADQPLAVTVSVDDKACEALMNALETQALDLTYVKVPVEFGRVGRKTV